MATRRVNINDGGVAHSLCVEAGRRNVECLPSMSQECRRYEFHSVTASHAPLACISDAMSTLHKHITYTCRDKLHKVGN